MTRREARRRERLQDRVGLGLVAGYFATSLTIGALMIDLGWGWF